MAAPRPPGLLLRAPDPRPVSGAEARRLAQQELSRAEYHRDDPGLLSRVGSWVTRHLARLFDGGVGGNALLLLLILLGAIVVFAVVRAGRPSRVARQDGSADDDPLRTAEARDHRRLAGEFEAAGQYAEALREWLRAAVRAIEERGVLTPRPGRTGAATAREAGPLLPSAAADLRAATTAFDEVWFGGRAAGADDAAMAHRAADGAGSARIERTAISGYAVPS